MRTEPGLSRAAERRLRFAAFALLLLLWWGLALVLHSDVLPTPAAVWERLWAHAVSGELWRHLGATLARVAASFLIAMLVGTAIGILLGGSRRLDVFFDGWLVLGLNIPALVTIILCYVWFGLNDAAAVLAVAANKIPTVVVTVREGARAVDRELLAVATAFRVPPLRRLTRVYLSQLLPYLFASARSGLSLIWKIVLVVELLGRPNGIGFRLNAFFQFFDIAGILAYTLAFAAVVLAVEAWLLRPLERRLLGWRA